VSAQTAKDPSSLFGLRRGKQRSEDRRQTTDDRRYEAGRLGCLEAGKARRKEEQKIRRWEDWKKRRREDQMIRS